MNPFVDFKINTIGEEEAIVEKYKGSSEFFEKHHVRFTLPKSSAKDEYNESGYHAFLSKADEGWTMNGGGFLDRLCAFFNAAPIRLTVRITQYGPVGDYDHRNGTVTINRHAHMDPVKIIKHEMTHVMVEPYVLKYLLNHEQKEFIVETLGTMFDAVEGMSDSEAKQK